jgi:pSer/pThr/pTyr-binding forkhead associated (FHA) protein
VFSANFTLETLQKNRSKVMPRVTITVPEKASQPYRFQLDRSSVALGRGSENDIVINCGSVSVNHAEMRRVPGGYELRDLGSTNGLKIYGARHQVIQLRNGIPVKLGDVLFDFLLTDEELTELKSEKTDTKPPQQLTQDDDSEPQVLPPMDSKEETQGEEAKEVEVKSVEAKDEEAKDEEAEDLEPEPEKSSSGVSGCAMILLFLVLASAAFVAGMAIRFQKDTGDSLINTLKATVETMSVPAKENPASKQE